MSPWFNSEDTPETVVAALDQRKHEQRRAALLGEVRRRDGDQCRFCRQVVDFLDRKSSQAGTYIHTVQSRPATLGVVFVACRRCSKERVSPLLSAPARPVYSEATSEWLAKHSDGERVVDQDPQRAAIREGDADERTVDHGFTTVARENRVRPRSINRRFGRFVSSAARKPRGRKLVEFPINPSALDEAVHHELLLNIILNVVPVAQLRVNVELLPLVQNRNAHNSSPSVGAPSGAVCDNPNPTDGELNPGAATSPNSAAPAPTQTEVQE